MAPASKFAAKAVLISAIAMLGVACTPEVKVVNIFEYPDASQDVENGDGGSSGNPDASSPDATAPSCKAVTSCAKVTGTLTAGNSDAGSNAFQDENTTVTLKNFTVGDQDKEVTLELDACGNSAQTSVQLGKTQPVALGSDALNVSLEQITFNEDGTANFKVSVVSGAPVCSQTDGGTEADAGSADGG